MTNVDSIPVSTGSMPQRNVLAYRLERQREKLFEAQAIIRMVGGALRHRDNDGFFEEALALSVAYDRINDAAGELESDSALDPEPQANDPGDAS